MLSHFATCRALQVKSIIFFLVPGSLAVGELVQLSPLATLEISRPWEGGLTEEVPSLTGNSEFTIEKTNRNLLVDENEETDFFFLNDTDNVTSIDELPTAELIVTADRLTGLGMGDDQLVGDELVEGVIRYTGLEELIINLGPGDNQIVRQHGRLHARSAHLVDRGAADAERNPGGERSLARRRLALAGWQDTAHDHFMDVLGGQLRALDCGTDRRGTQIGCPDVLEIALEAAHRRSGRGDDDNGIFGGHAVRPYSLRGRQARPWRPCSPNRRR